MRAVLIVNPTATSTTTAGRDLLAHALKSRLELTVEHTAHRGHAGEIARAAVKDGVDLVVVHGGDGTVSNVVNGLLGPPGELPNGHVPALAIVPGGSANVTARSLGIPPGPVDATNQLIWLLDRYGQQKAWRRIGLIDCGEQLGGAQRRHGRRRRSSRRRGGQKGQGPSRSRQRAISARRCALRWPTPVVNRG